MHGDRYYEPCDIENAKDDTLDSFQPLLHDQCGRGQLQQNDKNGMDDIM